ncbi:MAG: phage tail protein, partial [Bacillus sp. (in: firmicutes)]
MSYIVDFKNVSTVGLESSPVVEALAGLRANEARYFMNKYKHEFTVVPASDSRETLDYVNRILQERDIEFAAKPLETSQFQVENIKWTYVFYEDGLSVNVLYTVDGPKPKRAVGFKLSEGMEVPKELEAKF